VEHFLQMLNIQMMLFVYMLVGYGCRKFGILKEEARDGFTEFVIYITLPCMIYQSFQIALTMDTLQKGALSLFVATAVEVLSLLISKVAFRFCKPDEIPIMRYGTLVSNSGFAGLPVIENSYGTQGLFYASIYIIPTRILMWSAGISLFTTAPRWERFKMVMLNPGIIAVELGFLRMGLHLELPPVLDRSVQALAECTTPLAMTIVGMILADIPLKSILSGKALLLSAIRQLVMPLMLLFALNRAGVDHLLTCVAVILTGMPIGSTTAILAAKYGANAEFASKCVFMSTVTSLITVPVLALFL
jgi:predicted permease